MVKSLRWRLQMWHAVVLTAVLSIFGTVVYSLHWQTRLQQIDAELDRTADVLMSRLRRLLPGPPARGPFRSPPPGRPGDSLPRGEFPRPPRDEVRGNERPISADGRPISEPRRNEPPRGERGNRAPRERGGTERQLPGLDFPEEFQHLFEGEEESRFYFVIWGKEGAVLEKSDSAPDVPNPELQGGEGSLPVRSVRSRDQYREVTHVARADINVLVGRSIKDDLDAEHRYGFLLFLGGTAVLAAGCLGGGWLSARAIRPIAAMTATAKSISAQNLDKRINLKETDTEFGQLAAVLNNTFDRLEAAFEQQSRFTADASHELRTPLSVILAHTELALSRQRSPEEYRVALEICQRASTRMKSLIEDLLMLARFDSNQSELVNIEFELAQVVSECVDLVQPLAEVRGIRIESQLESVRVRGDRGRISQVVTNLLSNAIRYNHDGGSVKISVIALSEGSVIRVADTGVGIPIEELPHIFDRFYRVDKARSRSDGGSGLGLSICKTIVEAHGGTISVSSESSKGTTVEVRLPARV